MTPTNSPERTIGPSQKPLPDKTQHSQQKNAQVNDVIRNRDPSKLVAVELNLDRAATGISRQEYKESK
jgi:hypothetical protein